MNAYEYFRIKVTSFSFLLERIKQKLQGWQHKVLSKHVKVTLLNTAAQMIPNSWMSLFLIPLEICESIEKKNEYFLMES